MKIWNVCLSTLTALAVTSNAMAQGGFTITHQPPPCLSGLCGKTALQADVTVVPEPQSVRIYFRAAGETADYYIEMTKTASGYAAVLPAPLRETTAVVYRIVASGADGSTSSSEPATVPVTASCQLPPLGDEQATAGMDTVIGLTEAGQSGAPKGFSCAGLTKVLGVDQTMSPNTACEEVKLSNSDPCFAPVPVEESAGVGLVGAAVLAAGVITGAVIIENNDDENRDPVSSSRP